MEKNGPMVVKIHDVKIDQEYAQWLGEIKSRYRASQIKAAVKVNSEQLLFNWQLGRDLVTRKAEEQWGAGVVEQLSFDLQDAFPEAKGFSTTNLWYMKQWYEFYSSDDAIQKLHHLGGELQLSDKQVNKKEGDPKGLPSTEIGILTIKSANQTVEDAAHRPDPRQLYRELWYEGEVCCLFADSNLGKSIFAVQMADEIARTANVLYVDCELSDKQFQLRYYDPDTGDRHLFPEGLMRAEVNPYAIGAEGYEEAIIRDIETAASRLSCKIIIIDNLTYLCNAADKGVDAGIFMMKLMALKKKQGLSLLIIAHTPKRDLSSPITQNHLAGSKKLYNFFDSVFAIGMSAKDNRLRYVKQVKVRAGAFRYDASNALVYEVEKTDGFRDTCKHPCEITQRFCLA